MAKFEWEPGEREKIRDMYLSNKYTLYRIGKELYLTEHYIYRALKEIGVPIKTRKGITDEEAEELVELWKNGATGTQLMRRYGYASPGCIYALLGRLRKKGWDIPTSKERNI